MILANVYDSGICTVFNASMKLLYCSLSRPPVDRPETPQGPGEPGDVPCTQHENQGHKAHGCSVFHLGEYGSFPHTASTWP